MKKSLYNYFTYSIYRYAPESFKLFFKGKEVNLSSYAKDKYNFGNIAITKGKLELMKIIKQYVRDLTVLSNNRSIIKNLAIRTNDGSYIKLSHPYGYGKVNIYNISDKLEVYKDLKKAYNNNNSNITMTTGHMDQYGKMSKGVEKEIQKPELLRRICYV